MAEHDAPLTEARLTKRRELCEAKVTLNGERAKIGGVKNAFATVTQFKTGLSCEFSWEAVERIVAKGGRFES